jgi:hypothetical protein
VALRLIISPCITTAAVADKVIVKDNRGFDTDAGHPAAVSALDIILGGLVNPVLPPTEKLIGILDLKYNY